MPPSPSAHSAAPTTSTLASAARLSPSGTTRRTRNSVISTIGTLIAKIQRQDALSTSWPPISGPRTVPIPPHAVHAPTARPRSSGGNVATITASAEGVRSAPNTPCSARATTSSSTVGARAQNTDVTPKPVTPSANTRRAPNRSPSEPATSRSELSVSRYAFEVHCCPARPPPRSSAIAGSATFTTVESTVTTVVPRIAATSVSRFCEAAGGGVASDLVLEEGVAVCASLVGQLGDRDHALVVVPLHLVQSERDTCGGPATERVTDIALLARGLHAVLLQMCGDARQHRDLRVDVGHRRREPLLVELARGDPASVLSQQALRDRPQPLHLLGDRAGEVVQ